MFRASYIRRKGGALFGLLGTTNVTDARPYSTLVDKLAVLTTAATAARDAVSGNKDKTDVMDKIASLKSSKRLVDSAYSAAVSRSVTGGRRTKRRGSSKSKTSKRR